MLSLGSGFHLVPAHRPMPNKSDGVAIIGSFEREVMTTRRRKIWILPAIAFSLFAPALATPQASAERQPGQSPANQQSTASNAKRKPTLSEATRVNTAEAVAKRQAEENASDKSAGLLDVLEFRSADQNVEASSGTTVASSKESKKTVLKNVHGTAYGSLDPSKPGNRKAGASVGATSKSGKSSVYLETDRSRMNSPH